MADPKAITNGSASTCLDCGQAVVFSEGVWDHVGPRKPRHPARPGEIVPAAGFPGPPDRTWYHPIETPPRYPLELTGELDICLWSPDGDFKWTVAFFVADREGYDLRFVGARPFDPRVDWSDFEAVARQGQEIADRRFRESEADRA